MNYELRIKEKRENNRTFESTVNQTYASQKTIPMSAITQRHCDNYGWARQPPTHTQITTYSKGATVVIAPVVGATVEATVVGASVLGATVLGATALGRRVVGFAMGACDLGPRAPTATFQL